MQNETPKTTRRARFKQWMSDHSEDLVAGSVLAGFAGLVVTAVVFTIKEENERLEKINNANKWLADEFNAGRNTYALDSGAYLSVDRESDQKIYRAQ